HRREAAGAVGFETDLLAGERRHLGDRHRFHRATRVAMKPAVEVNLDLAREARERLRLQEVAVLRIVIDDADHAEIELAVRPEEVVAAEARAFVRRPEIRTVAVLRPVLVDELPKP